MSVAVRSRVSPSRVLPDLYAPIVAELAEVEQVLALKLQPAQPKVVEIIQHVQHYRGKRLRPALLLLVGKASGNLTPAHAVLGAVVEMIHTATLVHDDVLDGATLRRHVPTVHTKWGTQTSILLGDYLFTHAFHLSATLGLPYVCELIGEATNRTCEGELRQGLEQGNLALSEAEYLSIIEAKTADLIACSCRLGALAAGLSNTQSEPLARYGRLLGLAFQIADDLLDLTGEEKSMGKSLGTDAEQQKLTLPLIHLLQGPDEGLAQRCRQLLLGNASNKRAQLKSLLTESGALGYAKAQADAYAQAASDELSALPDSECKHLLKLLCVRVVQRQQ